MKSFLLIPLFILAGMLVAFCAVKRPVAPAIPPQAIVEAQQEPEPAPVPVPVKVETHKEPEEAPKQVSISMENCTLQNHAPAASVGLWDDRFRNHTQYHVESRSIRLSDHTMVCHLEFYNVVMNYKVITVSKDLVDGGWIAFVSILPEGKDEWDNVVMHGQFDLEKHRFIIDQ